MRQILQKIGTSMVILCRRVKEDGRENLIVLSLKNCFQLNA